MVSERFVRMAPFLVVPMLTVACATKKFVRNTVEPLEAHLGKVQQKTDDNSQQIKDVDRKAESGIADAANRADQAAQQASSAQKQAADAQQTADKGLSQANTAQQMVENADNFKPVKTATVLFAFNQSKLTPDGKQELDGLSEAVKSMKHYVLEVQGFTDTTGPSAYNLELSRRRAQAVVRYLTLEQKVPLVRIYMLGYGEEAPSAPNKTRQGRKLNRRVEVTLMSPQVGEGQQAEATTTTLPPQQ